MNQLTSRIAFSNRLKALVGSLTVLIGVVGLKPDVLGQG